MKFNRLTPYLLLTFQDGSILEIFNIVDTINFHGSLV